MERYIIIFQYYRAIIIGLMGEDILDSGGME